MNDAYEYSVQINGLVGLHLIKGSIKFQISICSALDSLRVLVECRFC